MKTTSTVIFVLLCVCWSSSADPVAAVADPETDTEAVTASPLITTSVGQETEDISTTAQQEVEQALAQESEAFNAIDTEYVPTKRPKRPHSNKHPLNHGQRPSHHHRPTMTWSYFPTSVQMPYAAPCPYPPPMYIPMPMYSPYFFPAFNNPSQVQPENRSPESFLESDDTEATESDEEVTAEELTRKANWDWNNKWADKENDPVKNDTVTTKPTKRFIIRNWIANKLDRKATRGPKPTKGTKTTKATTPTTMPTQPTV